MEMLTKDTNLNPEMNIRVNEKDEIVQYAIVGGVGEKGIYVPYEVFPSDFFEQYEYKYYLYKDGKVSVNPDYEPKQEIV